MATSNPATLTPEYLAEDESGKLITVMWVATILPFIFVSLRLYVRTVIKKSFGWDDGIACVALACLIGYSAVVTAAALQGLGKHIEAVILDNPQHLINIGLLAQISQTLAIAACTLGKTSFAVTLLRIVTQRWLVWTLWFIIITMNLVNLLAAIFVFVQCKDPRHLWNPAIPSECWPTYVFTNFSLFVGAYSGAQDFALALLPWTVILRLQMRTREKVAVGLAMSLGIFAGITAIVKTTFLVNLSKRSDFTFALPPLLMWAAAEDGLALVAASLATLRPLLRAIMPRSTTGDSYKNISNDIALKPQKIGNGPFGTTKGETRVYASKASMDDQSDRSILEKQHEAPLSEGNIQKTTEYAVNYRNA